MQAELQRNNRVYDSKVGFPIEFEATTIIDGGGDLLNARSFDDRIVYEADNLMGVIDYITKRELFRIVSNSYFDLPTTIASGIAYMVAHGKPAAIDVVNGNVIWIADKEGLIIGSSNDCIFCYDDNDVVYCRSGKEGAILWINDSIIGGIRNIAIENDILILLTSQQMCRIKIDSGSVEWIITAKDLVDDKTSQSKNYSINLGPLIEGVQYLSTTDGSLFAVDSFSGQIMWKNQFDLVTFPYNIFYYKSILLFDSFQGFNKDNYYYGAEAESGKLLFRSDETISPKGASSPIVTNGFLIGGKDEYLSFFDIEKVKFVYRYKHPEKANIFNFIQPYENRFIAWKVQEKEFYWFKSK
jgi:outer membrane protein assembly factor BamB